MRVGQASASAPHVESTGVFRTYWAKMKATDVAAKGPPEGKDHHAPEHYFEDVLEGARLIEGQCSKNMIFE